MENWMVMGGAVLLVCMLYPPFLGFVIGVGIMAVATMIVFFLIRSLMS